MHTTDIDSSINVRNVMILVARRSKRYPSFNLIRLLQLRGRVSPLVTHEASKTFAR
jgi:hypothetical protein